MRHARWALWIGLLVVGLFLAACGSESPNGDTETSSASPSDTNSSSPSPSVPPSSAEPTEPTGTSHPADPNDEAPPAILVGADEIFVGGYSFTPGVIELPYVRQPSRLEGLIAIPPGEGPFPVAVFVHGLGHSCTGSGPVGAESFVTTEWNPPCSRDGSRYLRNSYAGTSIVESIARRNVVAISIDVNAAYFWWGGEVSDIDVIDRLVAEHLRIVEDVAAGAVDLDGFDGSFVVDTSRLALIGHSRGGGFAEARLAATQYERQWASPEPSVVALLGSSGDFFEPELAVDLLNIRAECDADVGSDAGSDTAAIVAGLGASQVYDVLIEGASHWALTSAPYGSPTAECPAVRDRSEVSSAVSQLVAAFVVGALLDSELGLPVDPSIGSFTVLAGEEPAFTAPVQTVRQPGDVPMTDIEDQRLAEPAADDRFLDETRLEDF